MGYLYRCIGLFILSAGVILSFFLPLIFPQDNTGFPLPLIYFAYYSFLTSSLIGYFINYRQTLLNADQKGYVVAAYFQTANIVKTIIQMISAYYTGNYYIWVIIEFLFGINFAIILNWKINETYPWLKTRIKEGHKLLKQYPDVITKTKQLFIHKLAGSICLQSYNIIIYGVASLSMVAMYGNYTLIIGKIIGLINTVLGSSNASVGNLAAQGNVQRTRDIYWEMAGFTSFIGGIVLYGLVEFSTPFIGLWVGTEFELALWMIIPYFIKIYCDFTTTNLNTFLFAHGLFYDVWAPFVESVICLGISIGAGIKWGLFGVLLGSMTSNLIINVGWKSYFLFSKGLRLPWMKFWLFYGKYIVVQISAIIAMRILFHGQLFSTNSNFIQLAISSVLLILIYTVSTGIILISLDPGLRNFLIHIRSHFSHKASVA
ncbi:sugar transporter [Muribaculum intestinale]|uniref:sugar transporter n=1 Tax=Muribaculum intestinale TaxID=1796646 RepID=UPI0025A5BB5C|nr:sugar transporter [Muribaculum intestinale]